MNIKTIKSSTLLLCLLLVGTAHANSQEDNVPRGTSMEELAVLKARPLPQPGDIKIAVLPFWDSTGSKEHSRMATSAVWLLSQREGFQMMPILDSFSAVDQDGDLEPGLPLRKDDAARIGKKLGAKWVIYGEVRELKQYKKSSFFKEAKYVKTAIRIAVVEVPVLKNESSDIIYWQMRNERRGGTGFFAGRTKSGDTLKRRAAITVSYDILKPLFDAFPAHHTDERELDSVNIAAFMNNIWPKTNQKDK